MRVAINCRSFLRRKIAGIGRYAFNLVRSLGELDPENEYWLYCRKGLVDWKRRLPRRPAKNFFLKPDYFGQGLAKILKGADVYHAPCPDEIDFDFAPVVVTVHDLVYKVFPEKHSDKIRESSDRHFNQLVPRAAAIICCSRSTERDLLRFFPQAAGRTRLVYQGVDKNIFYPLNGPESREAQRLVRAQGITRPFLLCVGTIEPRKNLLGVLNAVRILKDRKQFDGQLVIVGMKGWLMEGLVRVLEENRLTADCVFPGYVSDRELRALYNQAEVFVYPSLYEGFGYPVVEAFSCGAAVVTSMTSACGEIAREAALVVDPENPEDIAGRIHEMISDAGLRQDMRRRGLARAQDFSFEKTARETLAVYRAVHEERNR